MAKSVKAVVIRNVVLAVASCKRETLLASGYGKGSILATLPLCMRDKTLE